MRPLTLKNFGWGLIWAVTAAAAAFAAAELSPLLGAIGIIATTPLALKMFPKD